MVQCQRRKLASAKFTKDFRTKGGQPTYFQDIRKRDCSRIWNVGMLRIVQEYYSKFFQEQTISPSQLQQELDSTAGFSTQADKEQDSLVRPIEEMEVCAASLSLKKGTSWGLTV